VAGPRRARIVHQVLRHIQEVTKVKKRTVAAVVGAMLGAAPLPARWLAQLELRPEIARVADDLHRSITGARLSPTDYPPS